MGERPDAFGVLLGGLAGAHTQVSTRPESSIWSSSAPSTPGGHAHVDQPCRPARIESAKCIFLEPASRTPDSSTARAIQGQVVLLVVRIE